MWQLILLGCLSLAAAGENDYLLPRTVLPVHYELRYLADLQQPNFTVYGAVDITLNIKQETQKIVLHAQEFKPENSLISLTKDGKMAAKLTDANINDTYNFFTLTFDSTLAPGNGYVLTIPFRANLWAGLDGAYISSYINKQSGEKEYLLTTQFEAISARKAFPCFDEPIFKATFSINIGHCKEFEAISNMPQERNSTDNALEAIWPWTEIEKTIKRPVSDFIWNHFQKSVPMSTYLVAFMVSKFGYMESPEGLSNTSFRIWARKDAIDQTEYASRVGPQVLSHFEKYFNVKFPLPKQDMVAIPDFSAGAMENWGLITYRETALLYDREFSSFTAKERVAEVIAHELAHQWFGNLVTMKWWSDLWLNEGFATYAASVGVSAVEPSWKYNTVYAVSNIMGVLNLDGLETSHPVSIKLDDPKRISEIFDAISYKKGSTLIRMMVMFLGEDNFRAGITNYLNKYSYSNAEQDDLWRELTSSSKNAHSLPSGVTVKDIMDTWTTQTGYPLLNVTRDYYNNEVTVTQQRYLSSGPTSTNQSWWVPISSVSAHGASSLQWLSSTEGVSSPQKLKSDVTKDDWLLLNPDMIAPIRVNYDDKNWQLLANAMNSDRYSDISVTGRVQLLSDAFALAWSDRLNYNTTLRLASYLQQETEYLPLAIGLSGLAHIENVLKRSPDYGAYQRYARKLISQTYERIGGMNTKSIKNEDDLNSVKLQTLVSSWACRMKVPGCEQNAIEMFQSWMDSDTPDADNPIPLDLRSTVYCVAISRGGVQEWRFAVERRQNTNVASVKSELLNGLSCTRDVWLLKTFLEWSITDNTQVRRQDSLFVIYSVTRSPTGYYVARDFIYNRIDEIAKAFKGQEGKIGNMIMVLLDQFTTQRELDEFLVWSEKNKQYLVDSKLTLKQGIEKAKVNIAWVEKYSKQVVSKLREYSK